MKKNLLFLIAVLLNCTILHAQKLKFGKVSKEELEEKFYPLDATADAAYLYNSRRTYFELNTSKMTFDIVTNYYHRIKIYSNEGFNYANIKIPFYSPYNQSNEKIISLKAVTYNLIDGKIKKNKLESKNIFNDTKSKYWSLKKFTLPNLKPGCIIEVKYQIISPYDNIRDLQFQYNIPVKKLEHKVEIPDYYNYKKTNTGYYLIAPIINKSGRTIEFSSISRNGLRSTNSISGDYSIDLITQHALYKADNIPSLKDNQPYISSINNYRGGVKFEISSIKIPGSTPRFFSESWSNVAKTIYNNPYFVTELNKSLYYKAQLQEILKVSATTNEKIWNIFNFVKNNVRWNGHQSKYKELGVSKAFKEHVGNSADINLMLVSMLRSANLNANPVLLSTRNNGRPIVPTLEGLNYVIASVKTEEGKYYLLDATSKYSVPNLLPIRTNNWQGHLVTEKGYHKTIPLSPQRISTESNTLTVKFDTDFNATGLLRSTFDNLQALQLRNKYNHVTEKTHKTALEKKYPIEIVNFKVTNQTKLALPVSRTIQFSSKDLFDKTPSKVYISPLLFLSKESNPFKEEKRTFPVEFNYPFKEINKTSIYIPENYSIESIPESFGIASSNGKYIYKFKAIANKNKVSILSSLEIKESMVPSIYYDELKKLYNQMITKQAEKIVLVKK